MQRTKAWATLNKFPKYKKSLPLDADLPVSSPVVPGFDISALLVEFILALLIRSSCTFIAEMLVFLIFVIQRTTSLLPITQTEGSFGLGERKLNPRLGHEPLSSVMCCCSELESREDQIFIVKNDKDLLEILHPGISQIFLSRPQQEIKFSCIVGDLVLIMITLSNCIVSEI
jgi:hypothetical protein